MTPKEQLEQAIRERIAAEDEVLHMGLVPSMALYHEGEKAAYQRVLELIEEILS